MAESPGWDCCAVVRGMRSVECRSNYRCCVCVCVLLPASTGASQRHARRYDDDDDIDDDNWDSDDSLQD